MENKKSLLSYAAVAFTLWTVVLYLAGRGWMMGLLKEFHLEASRFPMSVDMVLFYGGAYNLGQWFFLAVTFLGALVPFLAPYLFFRRMKFFKAWRLSHARMDDYEEIQRDDNISGLPSKSASQEDLLSRIVVWFSAPIIVVTITAILLDFSADFGREAAGKIKSLADKGGREMKVIHMDNGSELVGVPILCSAAHCAYYDGRAAFVVNENKVFYIESCLALPNGTISEPCSSYLNGC